MAVIVLNASKRKMKKSSSFGIGYITREDKAYKTLFLNCTEENYAKEFQKLFELREVQRKDSRTFYHIKQSFDDSDNVDYETAFSIAQEFANKYYEEGYQVVCATHKDTKHIHNHIIFSAVNFDTLKSFSDTKQNLKELIHFHDQIMKKYNFKTQEELAKEKIISRKESIEENKLKDRGVFTNKELITYAIDSVIKDKKRVKSIYDFVKELNRRYQIHCYFRGSFINFQLGEKKYRGVNLGQAYSFSSIKRRCEGNYSQRDEVEDRIKTLLQKVKTEEEFFRELKKGNIKSEETTSDFLFEIGKEKVSIKELTGHSKEQFFKEISLNKLKKDLKFALYHIKNNPQIDNFEKWKEEVKKLDYVDEVKESDDTVFIVSSALVLDIKKLGYGEDDKNRFSIENIKKNLFIKKFGNELKEQVKRGTISSVEDVLNYCKEKNIGFASRGKDIFLRVENQDIHLKRFFVLKKELEKKEMREFFLGLKKIKSIDDLEKLPGVYEKDGEYYFKEIHLSEIKYNNHHLNHCGIINIIEKNIYQDILRRSYSYAEFLEKYKEKKLSIAYIENEVRNKVNQNQARKIFKQIIKESLSKEEIISRASGKGKFVSEEDSIYFSLGKGNSGYYHTSWSEVERRLKEKAIKNVFFSSLKKSLSCESMKEKIRENGYIFEEREGFIYIDGINFTKKRIQNEFGTNFFSKEYIEERIKENFDYVNKTTTSIRYQFKEVYLNALKESHSIEEFKSKLLQSSKFDFKFEEDTIFFKQDATKWKNAKEYNFYDSNFYSISSAQEWIEKKVEFEKKNRINDFFLSILQIVQSGEERKEKHRSINSQSADYFKHLRIKREMEEKYRL